MNITWKDVAGWNETYLLGFYERIIQVLRDDAIFVEMGTYAGQSAIFAGELIQKSNKKINFITLDNGFGSGEEDQQKYIKESCGGITLAGKVAENIYNAGLSNHIVQMNCSSEMASKIFPDNYIDIVFIDGSHDSNSVQRDIELWYPKVRVGGIISGHDYCRTSVSDVVNKILAQNNLTIFGNIVWYANKT